MKNFIHSVLLLLAFAPAAAAQESVARQWNEVLLQSIREDFARPPVHARNLLHTSIAMYDAWAAYDTVAKPYLLGNTVAGYTCPFKKDFPKPANIEAARDEAISFAIFRVLLSRFVYSPNVGTTYTRFYTKMVELGYDYNNEFTDYENGSPAALGNYIAECVLQMGLLDGSNELGNYASPYYFPRNPSLVIANPGNPTLVNPNLWQPLTLANAIDQNGNPIPATQSFQSPEWGRVVPFALKPQDLSIHTRNNRDYWVYKDPGAPPLLNTMSASDGKSVEFKWNMELVAAWGAHLDPDDGVMWDISPASIGNVQSYPQTLTELRDFYDLKNGGDPGKGRPLNPKTGQPYEPQIVPRGDYTRVLAQFWADGPNSETPPGHWFAIMNKASDHPDFAKKFNGQGPVLGDLEWDVKAYVVLGGAVHDAAVTAWGIKGWYDAVRPISVLRYMAGLGQSSDPNLPKYHPGGVTLIPGFVEMVQLGDPLVGANNEHLYKIKFFTWKGFSEILDPTEDYAGAGWILAENWMPYQRNTFVTPPFAGYISGHSTYSRSAAEALTLLTGDEYFPGGMEEYVIPAYSQFLGFEAGPSVDVHLQWATYRDASDQTSLSRIWGGIHPPFDDIPGRKLGAEVGIAAFHKAVEYFYPDADGDGYLAYQDCNDHDAAISPDASEICDHVDNDCNGTADDGLPTNDFFPDADGDGYGSATDYLSTCEVDVPNGYTLNNEDCDDANFDANPSGTETCDGADNDCNGTADDGLPTFDYYADADGDGFGDANAPQASCQNAAPTGFSENATDCNDADAGQNPGIAEICDGTDNDCSGAADDGLPTFDYYADGDGDGFGDAAAQVTTCVGLAPMGYTADATDCDDQNASANPSQPEVCDDADNDCNGLADDGLLNFAYFADADADGFGNANELVNTCQTAPPMGYVANNSDCDDQNVSINPSATEVCDDEDNDCNGTTDDGLPTFDYFRDADGDGFGNAATALTTCKTEVPPGFVTNSSDCDDANASVNPSATEVCDDADNNCDGAADEGLPTFDYYADGDGDGFGQTSDALTTCQTTAPTGFAAKSGDCDDANASINPSATEVCDDVDNDCNGAADDGLPVFAYFADADQDGFGDSSNAHISCLDTAPTGFVTNSTDCNDANTNANPSATEVVDGVDNDCDGQVDETSATAEALRSARVFPNPVRDFLYLTNSAGGEFWAQATAASGQMLWARAVNLSGGAARLDFSGLPSGLYLLRLTNLQTGEEATLKVVKMD